MTLQIYFSIQNSWPTVALPAGVLPAWTMSGSGVAWPLVRGESPETWADRTRDKIEEDFSKYRTSHPELSERGGPVILNGERPLNLTAFGRILASDPALAARCKDQVRRSCEIFRNGLPNRQRAMWNSGCVPLARGQTSPGYLQRIAGWEYLRDEGATGERGPLDWDVVNLYPKYGGSGWVREHVAAQIDRGCRDGIAIHGAGRLLAAIRTFGRDDAPLDTEQLRFTLDRIESNGIVRVLIWSKAPQESQSATILADASTP